MAAYAEDTAIPVSKLPNNDKEIKNNNTKISPSWRPYMRNLEQKIKSNWKPPLFEESKRIVVIFTIGKDGKLLKCKITKSSGIPLADEAALKAIELALPFEPLPKEFKGESVPIEFTFDYNVKQVFYNIHENKDYGCKTEYCKKFNNYFYSKHW